MIFWITVSTSLFISFFFDSFKKNRLNVFLVFALLPIMMFNFVNPDYLTYEGIFLYSDVEGIAEPGFIMLINILKRIGFQNYSIIPIVLAVFIGYTFFRFSKYIDQGNIIVWLYFVFPFMIDIIQIRNTIMIFLVLNATLYYIELKKIKCFFLILLSITFHSYGIVWLIFFILIELRSANPFKKQKSLKFPDFFDDKNRKYNLIIILLGIGNIFVGNRVIVMITNWLPTIATLKLSSYLTPVLNLDSLFWGVFLISDLIVFYYILKIVRKRNEEVKDNNAISLLYYLLFHGLLLVGTLLYLYESNRLFRALFLFKYFLFGTITRYLSKKERRFLLSYIVIISIAMSVIYFFRGIDYDGILMNNYLFGKQ